MAIDTTTLLNQLMSLKTAVPIQHCLSHLIEHGLSNNGKHQGLKTGFAEFDAFTHGLHAGDLIVLTGYPGVGKTALALNIVEQCAVLQQRPVVYVSTGASARQLSLRLVSSMARVHASLLRGGEGNDQDHSRYSDAIEALFPAPLCFIDDVFDPQKLCKRLGDVQDTLGGPPALTIVDNLELLADPQNGGANMALRLIKRQARKMNAPVLVLSNVSSDVSFRLDPRPRLGDISENTAIEASADVVLSLYRDDLFHRDSPDFGEAELAILKWNCGPLKTFRLAFLEEWSRFSNLSDVDTFLP